MILGLYLSALSEGGGPPLTLASFPLSPQSTLASLHIHDPTPIQAAAVAPILEGRHTALRAPTGAGKTYAFLLPVLTAAVRAAEAEYEACAAVGRPSSAGSLQAVVVSPSRELAMQTVRAARALLPPDAANCVCQAIGGANPHRQVDAIKKFAPILIVGTPGRLAEMSREGILKTHNVAHLVLDEADQLLAPQFREDLVRLADHAGKGRRAKADSSTGGSAATIVLASATLTPAVVAAYARWAPDAVFVAPDAPLVASPRRGPRAPAPPDAATSKPEWGWGGLDGGAEAARRALGATSSSAGGVASSDTLPALPPSLTHAWVKADPRLKTDALRKALHALGARRALIFMNAGRRLKDTGFKLAARGIPVATLHGDLPKAARAAALADFSAGRVAALLVSDVAARGLDVPSVDVVVNMELPSGAAHYAHRAGRTGRAGRPGVVLSLVEPGEEFVVAKLAKRTGVVIDELRVAGGRAERVDDRSVVTAPELQ